MRIGEVRAGRAGKRQSKWTHEGNHRKEQNTNTGLLWSCYHLTVSVEFSVRIRAGSWSFPIYSSFVVREDTAGFIRHVSDRFTGSCVIILLNYKVTYSNRRLQCKLMESKKSWKTCTQVLYFSIILKCLYLNISIILFTALHLSDRCGYCSFSSSCDEPSSDTADRFFLL